MANPQVIVEVAPLVFTAFIALLVFVMVILAVYFPGRKFARRGQDTEEARLMQDLHRTLQKIEDRVESLETIMLEKTTDTTRQQAE